VTGAVPKGITMTDSSPKKRLVLITGASRGIGNAIAKRFLFDGYPVAAGYCAHPEGAQKLAAEFPDAFAVRIDAGDRQSIRHALQQTRERFEGSTAILVNNGAIAQEKPFMELRDEDWDRMMGTNLRGPFSLAQEVLPAMLDAGWGRIINLVSIGGQWGGMNQVHYAAAKAGLINLTRSLAKLYSRRGVTTNAVSPGLVATDMTATELASEAGLAKVDAIPCGRLGTLEEIAAAVAWLASDEAAYVTGQTLNLNGGMYFV
jgi:NAD(P)-dependent dehydrogenase (short-subunit alcohol dehydrogenase family)